MLKGTLYGLAACFIWGLIFVVPQMMSGFNSFEIAVGRYTCYGLLSILIFLKARISGNCRYTRDIWIKALYFSLVATFVYYIALILALRYANPAVCTLLLGVSPVTIAFYGNWKRRECNFGQLIPSALLICMGLMLINLPYLLEESSVSNYVLGLGCCLVALTAWSWYVVANAQFLKDYPTVLSTDWSTLIGVCALFWVAFFGLGMWMVSGELLDLSKFNQEGALFRFLAGSAILGVLCSWLGAYLWNQASFYLPIALAGQLTIFETIFGLLFVHLWAQTQPSYLEWSGVIILLGAVAYGIRVLSQREGVPAVS